MKIHLFNKPYKGNRLQLIIICLISLVCFNSCKKYLDAKPDQSIATPSTIEDLEGILNAYSTINGRYPSASEVASDDYYLVTADFNSLIDPQRFYYSWQKLPNFVGDYKSPYQAIEYCNIILDELPKVSGGNVIRKNSVQGNALFVRASYHYALSQLYAKVYNQSTAGSDLGIALRLTSDIAIKPVRSTVADTYGSVLNDLKQSIPLLPAISDVKYRSSKAAAYGMLARVYLAMSDFTNAGLYADSALSNYNKLIDYNTLTVSAAIPFKQFNDEVIYDSKAAGPQALSQSKARVDTLLYASYSTNDLRRNVLFKVNPNGTVAFKGNYTGVAGASLFTGIATNELYLIKAETAVRNGDSRTALTALNSLLVTRWKSGTFVPYAISDQKQLLGIILKERRKDLPFRSLRWTDLRRLNMEPDYAKILVRNLTGGTYTLEPNGLRYVFQIDQDAVNISGLQQNP
ncbi:RagB/SusD family nutrient uptake outer membrane protein [Mucilaginibacter glaciei]|uniref:RagB/SusD family nutrient uptake outer membrane protein n=1 Tax=Mucilaginibacter glaciei TaxID=2772109 RepID=A0A926P034_9SPHI|nr:RagB/SusD family nutrient uptake outer membrane protein [Mucilaginibacter glaciei]MBD1395143.1 RagB/SusD family nutrient uptake outer membrane protein [Mucilaginibacter glaciei]